MMLEEETTIEDTRFVDDCGVPALKAALADGIQVLDVGCGSGRAVLRLARAFPASRFTGYDPSEDAIGRARAEARWEGLTNVRFEQLDASEITERSSYDLAFALGASANGAGRVRVLANVHRALKPGGLLCMQEARGSVGMQMLVEAGFADVTVHEAAREVVVDHYLLALKR